MISGVSQLEIYNYIAVLIPMFEYWIRALLRFDHLLNSEIEGVVAAIVKGKFFLKLVVSGRETTLHFFRAVIAEDHFDGKKTDRWGSDRSDQYRLGGLAGLCF